MDDLVQYVDALRSAVRQARSLTLPLYYEDGGTMTLGHLLQCERVKAKLPQKTLAHQLGVTANYLSLVEHDRRTPSLRFLRMFASTLKIPLGLYCLMYLED